MSRSIIEGHNKALHRTAIPLRFIAALEVLTAKFDQWRIGTLSSDDLRHTVREYHDCIGREIRKRYTTNKPEMPLAHAVAAGFITKDALPQEVLAYIEYVDEVYEGLLREERVQCPTIGSRLITYVPE